MTDRPILFSSQMVRALLAGQKTQTRRLSSSSLSRACVGDRLWVREKWARTEESCRSVRYTATDDMRDLRRRAAIHMPRWASRLTLLVTEVRRQPLCSISDADAAAEGVKARDPDEPVGQAAYRFRELWDSLHGAESWDSNPEVIVITFEVVLRVFDHA